MGFAPSHSAPRVKDALRGEGRPLKAPNDLPSRVSGILVFLAVPNRIFFQGLLVSWQFIVGTVAVLIYPNPHQVRGPRQ